MLMHDTLESAKSCLNPERHWLVKGSFLLTKFLWKLSVQCGVKSL